VEDDHCTAHPTVPVVDRRRGILDRILHPVASQQHTVGSQPDDPILLNGELGGIRGGLARRAVDDVEDLRQRPTACLGASPAGHRLGHGIQVGHPSQQVGAQYRVTDGIEGDLSALLFLEQRFLRRTQRELDRLPFGDVLDRLHAAAGVHPLAHPLAHRRAIDAGPHNAPVWLQEAELRPESLLAAHGFVPLGKHTLPIRRMDRRAPLRTQRLRERQPGDRVISSIGVDAAALLIGDEDA